MPAPRRPSRGSAVVDFVLVLAVLVPLFLGILQVGLVLLVRNTLANAAAEGARYAASLDRDLAAGEQRTREQVRGAVSERFARDVEELGVIEREPKHEGRTLFIIIAPKKEK